MPSERDQMAIWLGMMLEPPACFSFLSRLEVKLLLVLFRFMIPLCSISTLAFFPQTLRQQFLLL